VSCALANFAIITLGWPGLSRRDQSCAVFQIGRMSVFRLVRTGSAWSLWEKRPALGWEFDIHAAGP
jgi:hypothetical protein